MVKYYCDHCKKEIEEECIDGGKLSINYWDSEIEKNISFSYVNLCAKCAKKIIDVIGTVHE